MKQKADIKEALCDDIFDIAELEKKYIPGGWSESGFREWHSGERRIFLKAVINDRIVGFVNGSWLLDEGELLNIAVDDEFRRCGIGRLLMQALFEKMREQGVEKLFLEVREKNISAQSFYQMLGFGECGRRNGYYAAPPDNAVILCAEL